MEAVSSAIFPCKKVSPIHAIPKMAITACIPAGKTEPCVAFIPSVLEKIKIIAAADSIIISIMEGISSITVSPPTTNEGLIPLKDPNRTISTVARIKIKTESFACFIFFTSLIVCLLSSKIPSVTRRWYSGSSTNSLPTLIEKSAPTNTPINVAGIVTFSISNKVILNPVSNPSKATVAADIGLAVIACWEAITAIPNGRSGRIFVSVATSAITGSTE